MNASTIAALGAGGIAVYALASSSGGSDGETVPSMPSFPNPAPNVITVPTGGSGGSSPVGEGVLSLVGDMSEDLTAARQRARDAQATAQAAQETSAQLEGFLSGLTENPFSGPESGSSSNGGDSSRYGGSGGSRRAWMYSEDSPGGTDYTMTESSSGLVRDAGATGKAIGDAGKAVGDTVTDVVDGIGRPGRNPEDGTFFGTVYDSGQALGQGINGYQRAVETTKERFFGGLF